jgi:hypothetical protein
MIGLGGPVSVASALSVAPSGVWDRAVARFNHDRMIACLKQDGQGRRVRPAIAEHHLKRTREPVAADSIARLLLGH